MEPFPPCPALRMKTFSIGAAGTLATMTLQEWSAVAAIAAGFSTTLWMSVQIYRALRSK